MSIKTIQRPSFFAKGIMPRRDISVDLGFQIGLYISLVLYGLYCALFGFTLHTRNKCQTRSFILTGVIIALFIMCTIITAFQILIGYNRMFDQSWTVPPGAFFVDSRNPRNKWYPVKDIFLLLSSIIADGLLVWRLYMIWNKDKKVLIVPSLVLLLIICTGVPSTIAECLLFFQPSPRASRLFQTLLPIGWTTALVNNFVCTLLIVWKLWRIARTAEGQSTAKLANPAITAFIESGALYTSTIFCMIVLMAAKMRGATCLVVVILPVIIGIAPTSIVLRLNLAAVRMSSRSVQNDGLFLPWAPSGERFHGEQKYQQSYVSIGVETIPEAVFAKRSGFTSNMISVDVSVESGYQSSTAPNQ